MFKQQPHLTKPLYRIMLGGLVFVVGIGIVAGLYSIYVSDQRKTVEQALTHHSYIPTQKALLLSSLRDNIGYGGFIHNFKNYVLRGDVAYRDAAIANYTEASRILGKYQGAGSVVEERAALNKISETLEQYRKKLDLAQRLYTEKMRPKDIDSAVKVSDAAAIDALNVLEKHWSVLHAMGQKQITKSMSDVETATSFTQMTIAVFLILSLIFLAWVYYLQRSLAWLIKELQDARDRAEQASRLKSEFLASMSHDFRTPLNAVLGFGQFLQLNVDGQLSERQRHHVDYIVSSGNDLLELVNDVLDLAQIEAKKISVSIETFDVCEIVNDCVNQSRPLHENRALRVYNEFCDGPEIEVVSDKARLKQIITNLLSNAIKYNNYAGSITVRGEQTADQFLRLFISDTGVGISEKNAVHIFDIFQRSDRNPDLKVEGTGIGLTVTKELVEQLAGTIGFKSEVDKGTTFWIEIPLASNEEVLIWTDKFRIGVDPIDSDHQVIAALYNKMLHESVDVSDVDETLSELIDYTTYHFRREETVMRVCGYPDLEKHSQQHGNLIKTVAELAGRLRKENAAGKQHLRKLLRRWFRDHILEVDNKIAKFAAGKEAKIRNALRALD